jgi:hypothetical protein
MRVFHSPIYASSRDGFDQHSVLRSLFEPLARASRALEIFMEPRITLISQIKRASDRVVAASGLMCGWGSQKFAKKFEL